jgi:4-hydroxybenzoate polyprenyltransferase
VIRGFPEAEDDFWYAVPQGAVMVHFREADILERQMPHAFERGIDIRHAAFHVRQQRPELLFCHPIKWYFSTFVARMLIKRLRLTLEMIRFEHSVFALPFALTGALLAFRQSGSFVSSGWRTLLWIVVAMVGARSAAMAFNRLVDADIDARNPRTRTRHIPAGLLSRTFCGWFTLVSCGVFLFAAWELNTLCFRLAPLALAVVLFYSYTKRFTHFSHIVLGFALGIAPAAAWIAVRGSLDPRILWLTAAVTFWTGGFDIIYSCQDFEFDRDSQLYSIPRALGIAKALLVARALHVLMIVSLLALVLQLQLGLLALIGIGAVAALLIYEHSLVKATDLSRVNAAFFTMNGWVSVLFFVFWAADIFTHNRNIQ